MARAKCQGCGAWVDPKTPGVAELVRAYRVNRGRTGGANQFVLPTSLGRWLCVGCLSVARGTATQQQSLW